MLVKAFSSEKNNSFRMVELKPLKMKRIDGDFHCGTQTIKCAWKGVEFKGEITYHHQFTVSDAEGL